MKCDFCEKEAIGYVSMQAAIYCGEHQTKAEEIESVMLSEHSRVQREIMDAETSISTTQELNAKIEAAGMGFKKKP